MAWYYFVDPEVCRGPYESRDEAVGAGRIDCEGEEFYVAEGEPFKLDPNIDWDWFLPERFDEANEEYLGEDYQNGSGQWSKETTQELYAALNATFKEWLERHKYDRGWALDLAPHETIPAQGIAAGTDAAEGKSPVATPCAQTLPDEPHREPPNDPR